MHISRGRMGCACNSTRNLKLYKSYENVGEAQGNLIENEVGL